MNKTERMSIFFFRLLKAKASPPRSNLLISTRLQLIRGLSSGGAFSTVLLKFQPPFSSHLPHFFLFFFQNQAQTQQGVKYKQCSGFTCRKHRTAQAHTYAQQDPFLESHAHRATLPPPKLNLMLTYMHLP